MERLRSRPRSRHIALARPLLIVAAAALALAVLAVAGMAATNGTRGATAPGANGCPPNKSAKTAPIADLAPPARLQIVSFDVLSGPVNAQTDSFTLKVRVGSTCSVNIKGASVYVTAVPYNQFSYPGGRANRGRRHHDPGLSPRHELPRERPTAAADALHPRNKAGRGPARRRLDTAARRGPFLGLAHVSCVGAAPDRLAARPIATGQFALNSGDHAAAEADGDGVCAGAGPQSPVDVADMHLDGLF